ncbi:MAG: DUF2237 family protein, partial [Sedimenticolaceae bacterium]
MGGSERCRRLHRGACLSMAEFERNALGGELMLCGAQPRTGYLRDGHCRTRPDDLGSHVVCARVTDQFLVFSR